MKRLLLSIVLVALLGGLFWWLRAGDPEQDPGWRRVVVERGTVVATISETGELVPRDPVAVQAPLAGRLEWLIDDGSWVEVGERIAILNDDQALTEVAEKRSELFNAEQELELARLKRDQAVVEEDQRVAAAERQVGIERFAYRVLTGEPQGAEELVRLDQAIDPLEADAETKRQAYHDALAAYREAEDAYLAAYDRWQDQQDAILRLQARIDELEIAAGVEPALGDDEARRKRDEAATELAAARAELVELRTGLPPLQTERDRQQAERDRHRPALDAALAAYEAAEEAMRDLAIRLEIEKRGLPLARLRIDEELAAIDLAEAEQALDLGESDLNAGSISEFRVAELRSAREAAANRLAIIRERIAIEAKPLPEAERLEAASKLEQAEVAAAKARRNRERELQRLDLEIDLQENTIAQLRHDLDRMAVHFPDVLRSDIQMLEGQLAELPPQGQAATRLAAQLDELRQRLAAAEETPPNVITAPAAGVVEVVEKDNRLLQAGDEIELREVVVQVKPRGEMAVRLGINEADIDRVAVGQGAQVTVPALPASAWAGTLAWIAGAGRDKFAPYGRWGADATAGVVEFDARVDLEEVDPAFRQGMTVLVAITTQQESDVLLLPRQAVRWLAEADRASVRTPAGERTIRCRAVGPLSVVVDEGLAEGDIVLVPEDGA